ncbi:MAG: AsmA family protein, partial [Desulfobacterales bacterium]
KKITGQSIPLKGAYGLSGKLTDPAQKKYKLGDLKLKLGKNNLGGSLDINLSGKKLELATNLAAPKFTLQPVTLPALETLAGIEDLGPLKLAFNLAGGGKKYTLANLDFKLGREDLIEVVLKGTISDLAAVKGMKLEFTAKGSDMANFKKLGGPEIQYKGAFDVTAQFTDPAPKVYKMPAFNATVGENNQTGWLELNLTAKRPSLKGELSSDKLDLRPLLAEEKEKDTENSQDNTPAAKKDQKSKVKAQHSKSDASKTKVFPAEPLPLEGLQALDVDLKFRDKQVLLPALALDDVIVDVLLKDGDLEIKPFKFNIGGGKADVRFALRSQQTPAALAAALNIDQLEIGPMLDQLGYRRSVEGNLNAAFNLDSTGDSIAALMAALNGNTRIAMSNGKAASEYLDLLAKYLGSGILRMLNPFQEKREYTPVNCFVNTIEIKDGLADVKLLLDTDRTSIFGAGDVNLKTEGLDLGIKPTPKKGALPANISFSFNELSQPFRLGGTLANPHLAIDVGRTAFVIGKMAGALALGPIGWAAFFADVSVGKKDACAVALGKVDIKGQPSDAKKPDEKKKEKNSGGFFKRLFGK